MEAVQVGHRDDEGGHAEQEQEQHLPHPEPVVGRRSQPNTAAANFSNTTLRTGSDLLTGKIRPF